MTDDFEILPHWWIVPQYWQSIALRNSLLDRIRHLGVNPERPAIAFNRLTTIGELIWTYNVNDSGIETLDSLKLFHVWHFNPTSGAACSPR